MARLVSLAILTGLIVFLGITFYQIVAPFLLPLFLAAVTAVWCQPLYEFFRKKCRGRDWLAAGATIVSVFTLLFVPLVLAVVSAAVQLKDLTTQNIQALTTKFENLPLSNSDNSETMAGTIDRLRKSDQPMSDDLKARIREWSLKALDYVKPLPGEEATTEERDKVLAEREQLLEELEQNLAEASQDAGLHLQELAMKSLGLAASSGWGLTTKTFGLLGAAVGMVIGLTVFLIGFYYFLCDGSSLLETTQKLIPVQIDYQRQLIHEFNRVMQSVVSATMLSSIAQGAATAIVLYILGFHNFFLLFVAATFASLIPIAGTWMVWGPCAISLWYGGSEYAHGSAIFLAIFGIGVIGTMDNVIKAYVLQSDTSLHPLLAFVSVFGGMQVMGLWGIFVGPVVACCLHALVKIFNTELSEFSKERFAKSPPTTESSPSLVPPAAAPATATPANG
ncbi:MAG: AI-2E family transporter [Planctomycetaceae bacterium]|nr:AI-2E family transporter [Planctomycetaceae bacterium]